MTLQFCKYIAFCQYSMVTILLSSPLQPHSDSKVTPYKKATLTGWQMDDYKLHNEIYYTDSMCIK